MKTAEQAFSRMGKNFMTPTVMEYIDLPRYLIELSTGRGFEDEPIYGVTVLYTNGEPAHQHCEMFHSEQAARLHIKTLSER